MNSDIAPKKVVFELLSHADPHDVGPRLGRLSITGRKALETPNFLAITSRGVVPHMTPDIILSSSEIGGAHLPLEDFIEKSKNGSSPPIMNCPGNPLHVFTSLPQSLITLLAPRRNPAVAAPNGNSNTAISLFTSTGFQELTNQSYVAAVEKLCPDISIALADIPYGTTPGAKRTIKMGDRTEEWLSNLIEKNEAGNAIFAAVLPIDSVDQSDYLNYVDEQANELAGLAFYDSNLLPDIPATTALSALPRLSLDEPASPHQLLRQISLGMDMFTIPFINFATDAGIVLSFIFPRPATNTETIAQEGSDVLPLGINIWTSDHATSLLPLVPSCTCYACTSHHRAFVQHLLSAKEMLGWVLIQIHNHHILSQFFKSVRQSISNGTFNSDVDEFTRIYESELPEKSGQGPRQRGYHNKSRANQQKINEKGWKGDPNYLAGGLINEDSLVPAASSDALEQSGFAEAV